MPAKFGPERGVHGTHHAIYYPPDDHVTATQAQVQRVDVSSDLVKSAWDNGPIAVILLAVLIGLYKIGQTWISQAMEMSRTRDKMFADSLLGLKSGFTTSMDKLDVTLDRLGERLGAADVRIETGLTTSNKEIAQAIASAGPVVHRVAAETGAHVIERLSEVMKYEGQKTRSLIRGESPSEIIPPRSGRRPDSDD